ncbi:MAG: hypothetical protein ABI904_02130 [Chloroflexota bacterium]
MKKSIQLVFLVFVVLAVLLGGCAPASTSIPPTFTPAQTYTPKPTSTPRSTSTPKPTSTPFVMPKGDFAMSWNIYSSEYNSLGGILTIRKQGSKYTEKLVMSDGSSAINNLTIISEGSEIKLTDSPGNSFGDYMLISRDGHLNFYDKQGFIYSVPLLK